MRERRYRRSSARSLLFAYVCAGPLVRRLKFATPLALQYLQYNHLTSSIERDAPSLNIEHDRLRMRQHRLSVCCPRLRRLKFARQLPWHSLLQSISSKERPPSQHVTDSGRDSLSHGDRPRRAPHGLQPRHSTHMRDGAEPSTVSEAPIRLRYQKALADQHAGLAGQATKAAAPSVSNASCTSI
jgi:hypothetical protein